jgi:hypothetical protein
VGVLTIHAGVLGEEHIRSAGVPRDRVADVIVQGVDRQGEFAKRHFGQQAANGFGTRRGRCRGCRAGRCRRVHRNCARWCWSAPICRPMPAAIRAATGWQVLGLLDSRVLAPHAAPPAASESEPAVEAT